MTKRQNRPTRYRSKPTEIEALEWKGTNDSYDQLAAAFGKDKIWRVTPEAIRILAGPDGVSGWLPVPVGDLVARHVGDNSDLWPLARKVLEAKYEAVTIGVIIHGDNPISGPATHPGGPPPAVADAIALRQLSGYVRRALRASERDDRRREGR